MSSSLAPSHLWEQVYITFVASIRSVGTACTLAAVGIYLHRRGFVVGEGKRTLALISQQVLIPLLFFTKIIFCNQDWSSDPCPDITDSLKDVWVLLIWPAYVVGVGMAVGYAAAKVSCTPPNQVRAVLVACAFGNATGLPITLLTVVHTNFPSDQDLGRIDPTLFLSVYLLLYPVLQWGVGGWLLAPEDEGNQVDSDKSKSGALISSQSNVLQLKTSESYDRKHRGIGETDASMYMSVHDNLYQLDQPVVESDASIGMILSRENSSVQVGEIATKSTLWSSPKERDETGHSETTALLYSKIDTEHTVALNDSSVKIPSSTTTNDDSMLSSQQKFSRVWDTAQVVVARCFQPPVIGALLGLFVASQPHIRGLFVDLIDRAAHAPLEWMFDGLYHVGEAAVPINMIILGCNLSASYPSKYEDTSKMSLFSTETTIAIVIGKMVVMPIIGFLSAYLCKTYWWETQIPDEIGGSFYLVVLIVFLTPTANNVMVMVELGGSGVKEAMARVIAWQYAVAPIVLSLTMTIAVCIAVEWS